MRYFIISLIFCSLVCKTDSLPCEVVYLDNICHDSICTFESIDKGQTIVADSILAENICKVFNDVKDEFGHKSDAEIWERDIFITRVLKLGEFHKQNDLIGVFSIEVRVDLGNYKALIVIFDGCEMRVLKTVDMTNNYGGEFEKTNLLPDDTILYEFKKDDPKVILYRLVKNGTYIGGMVSVTVDLLE